MDTFKVFRTRRERFVRACCYFYFRFYYSYRHYSIIFIITQREEGDFNREYLVVVSIKIKFHSHTSTS